MIRPARHRLARSGIILRATLMAALLFVGLAVLDTSTAGAQRPTPARVAGVISNGTDGAEVPVGFELALLAVKEDAVVEQRTFRVEDTTTFEFTDLLDDPDIKYRLAWEYEGVTDSIALEDEAAPANLPVVIYETTDSLDVIRVSSHATIVPSASGDDQIVGVLDLVTLRNDSDRTFVPDPTAAGFTGLDLVRFSLPDGYQDLFVDSDLPQGQMLEVPTGFAITNPIPPGDHRILYSYVANYSGDALRFTRTLPFGADEVRVLIPPEFGRVVADGLTQTSTTELGDTTYDQFSGSGYQPGFRMSFAIEGLPKRSLFRRMSDALPGGDAVVFGLPIAVAIAMGGLVLYVLVTGRRRRAAAALSPAERAAILEQIVELDLRHDSDEMSDEEYRAQRDELTARALSGVPEASPETPADAPSETVPAEEAVESTGTRPVSTPVSTGDESPPDDEPAHGAGDVTEEGEREHSREDHRDPA